MGITSVSAGLLLTGTAEFFKAATTSEIGISVSILELNDSTALAVGEYIGRGVSRETWGIGGKTGVTGSDIN